MATRGGRRQGTPGKAYAQRTDLNVSRAPQTGTQTAAAGGQTLATNPFITPDQVPKLDDPTGRPQEPVTTGLMAGAGAGPEAMGYTPAGADIQTLQAAYLRNPNPQLRRVIDYLSTKGRI